MEFDGRNEILKFSKCFRNIIETSSSEYLLPAALVFQLIENLASKTFEICNDSDERDEMAFNNRYDLGSENFQNSTQQVLPLSYSNSSLPVHNNNTLIIPINHNQDFRPARHRVGDSGVGDVFESTEAAISQNCEIISTGIHDINFEDLGIEDFYFDDDEIDLSGSVICQHVGYPQQHALVRQTTNIRVDAVENYNNVKFSNASIQDQLPSSQSRLTVLSGAFSVPDCNYSNAARFSMTHNGDISINGRTEKDSAEGCREKWRMFTKISSALEHLSAWWQHQPPTTPPKGSSIFTGGHAFRLPSAHINVN